MEDLAPVPYRLGKHKAEVEKRRRRVIIGEKLAVQVEEAKKAHEVPEEVNLSEEVRHTLSQMSEAISFQVVEEYIPDGATPEQIRWIMMRMVTKSDAEASRASQVSSYKTKSWANKRELDEAVRKILIHETFKFAGVALQSLALDAVATLAREMSSATGSRERVAAANSILDRIGMVRGQDLTVSGMSLFDAKEVILVKEFLQEAATPPAAKEEWDDRGILIQKEA